MPREGIPEAPAQELPNGVSEEDSFDQAVEAAKAARRGPAVGDEKMPEAEGAEPEEARGKAKPAAKAGEADVPDELVDAAIAAGFTVEDLEGFTVEKALKAIADFRTKQAALPSQQPPPPSAQTQQVAPDGYKPFVFDVATLGEHFESPVMEKLLTPIQERFQAYDMAFQGLAGQLEDLRSAQREQVMDGFFAANADRLAAAYGRGATSSLARGTRELQARQTLYRMADTVRRTKAAEGESVTLLDALPIALNIQHPNIVASDERERIRATLRKRRGMILGAPVERTTPAEEVAGDAASSVKAAARAVRKVRKAYQEPE